MLMPERVKWRKQHRIRTKGIATRGNKLSFGDFGLKAIEPGWITSRQIEAARLPLTQVSHKSGKMWIRIFPDRPVTKKPAETRMGGGKGDPEFWTAIVKPGRILLNLKVFLRKRQLGPYNLLKINFLLKRK